MKAYKTKDRPPTKDDCTFFRCVLGYNTNKNDWETQDYAMVTGYADVYPYWSPLPPMPEE